MVYGDDMTIEEKCQKLNPTYRNILDWKWFGTPMSSCRLGDKNTDHDSSDWITICNTRDLTIDYYFKIDKLIRDADASECLTSSSHYIRGYKKWLMENQNDYRR